MVLLVATNGEAGLPLGIAAWLGTGEARAGGEVGTGPLAVAGLELVVDEVTRTWLTVMSVELGEMTRPVEAVLIAAMLAMEALDRVDLDDLDMSRRVRFAAEARDVSSR